MNSTSYGSRCTHALYSLLLLLLSCCCGFHVSGQCEYGDPCMVPNTNCYDAQYPEIEQFVTAGVIGGIPSNLTVVNTLNPGDNLQLAIDNANAEGGGVVLLNSGVYTISSTINMRSNVVLRGVDSASVILESLIRSTWSQGKKNTVQFVGVSNAGLEDLTIYYRVDGNEPIDRPGMQSGGYCDSCFQNDPHGANDLYVRQVEINVASSNCWLDGCQILKSGTDPVYIRGNHNTMRNCYLDRSYNKGGSGNGYVDIRGDYNLFVGNTVRRIRHFTLQLGAQYNVVFDNYLEVDVNFHNGDAGNNLIEQNTIYIPYWRGWDVFSVGVAGTHAPPGPDNIMVNNVTTYRWFGPRYSTPDGIYTFDTLAPPVLTTWSMPMCGTFYPMIQVAEPLGVEGLTFEAQLLQDRSVQLNWTVQSQSSNDYFTLEKSTTGADWETLGIVDGSGTITTEMSYSFVDDHPLPGMNYYRILETDFNGQTTSSGYCSLKVGSTESYTIFPNPASDKVTVSLTSRELHSICIKNAQGQELALPIAFISDHLVQFDCSGLSEGIYFIELRDRERPELNKIVIKR